MNAIFRYPGSKWGIAMLERLIKRLRELEEWAAVNELEMPLAFGITCGKLPM